MLSRKHIVFLCLTLFVNMMCVKCDEKQPPNIIFIMADDLGWNDVGFHGSNQIPTPNIDALAYSGVILNNYYVNPICTPSRSALMTGKYPIHTGMQHTVLFGAEPRGLPLTEKLLPEYLKELGYTNRIVGKWHLGSYKREYTPTYRGFDSHLGCWTGHIDYNDHTAMENPGWGLDMRRNLEVAYDLHGKYATDLYTHEAVRLITTHNNSEPLFLYLAHNAVHSGNPYNPILGPDDAVSKFDNITNYDRRRFAGVLSKLDESVGNVVKALETRNMLQNSVIIFSTDNGGPAEGFNLNAASNWPLRGVKNTLWEGGVRGAGLIWSPLLIKSKRVATQMIHITDWLPTLYSIAGGNSSEFTQNIDGINVWNELSKDIYSKRNEILHNIDDIYGSSSILVGQWKLVKGTNYNGAWDHWYGPSGREGNYSTSLVANSFVGKALHEIDMCASEDEMVKLRKEADVICPDLEEDIACSPLIASCLFNVIKDPCEKNNLAKEFPNILKHLEINLEEFNKTAIAPGNKLIDLRGDPKYWDNTFTNFGDYDLDNKTYNL